MASEFLEILSEGALEELKQVEALVKSLATDIKSINSFKASNTPSGADNNIKKINQDYTDRGNILKSLGDKINEVAKNQNNLTAKTKEAFTAEQKLTEAVNKTWNAQDKKAKQLSEEERAYNKVLAKQQSLTKNIRDLVVETGKESEAVKKLQTQLDALNTELLQAEQASKKYAIGASSLATPVLLFAEAQKKATQATKEANAEKAKSNAMISKQMTGSMVESVNAIGKPTESLKRMNDYYRELEKTSLAESKSVLANENLSRAYVQLTTNREKAKNKLQDLIASERASNSEIRKAQKEFDVLNKKVAAADKAVGRFSDANRKINGLASSVGNLMTAFGVGTGLYLAIDIGKSIYNNTKELQSLDLALKMVSGTNQEYAENQNFVREVSEKWGLEVKSLTQQYTQFYTASKGLISQEAIKTTFEGIAKAGSVMGLSLEKQKDAFYAIDQMMSKGNVTAEELKKQLGNAMPGAIKAAAMAYQELHPQIKTIQEAEKGLYEAMKKGALDSATYVPLIVKNLNKIYGIEMLNKVDTLQASQNRLQNSWTELVRSLNNSETGGLTRFFTFFTDNLALINRELTRINDSWDSIFNKSLSKGRSSGKEMFGNLLEDNKKSGLSEEKVTEYVLGFSRKKLLELRKKESEFVKALNSKDYQSKLSDGRIVGKDFIRREREILLYEIGQTEEMIGLARLKLGLDKEAKKPKNNAQGETDKEKKARLKLEKEQAKEREQILKEQYEAELSNLEKRKEALSNYLENEKNFNKEEISAFKFGTDQKMKYALKLAQAEINIAELVHKEKTRIAKKDALDRKLNPTQTKNLLIPIDADLQKSKQDAILKGANTFTKTYSEYYKELSKNAEIEADAFQKAMDKYKMTDEQKKALEESEKLREKASEDVKNYIASFQTELGQNLGFDETANFFLKMDEDGRTMYDKLNSMADGSKEKQIATFQAIAEAAQETFNFIANASQENFEAEYSRLEKQKETALQFAGESDAAKKKIEEDYENRRKEIAKREFRAKQKIALVNIAIDIAQAVAATVGKTGFFGIPLAAIVATLGAAQLAIVASQKVPEYWKGTGNALEGLALTQERGAEIITDKKGIVKDFGDNRGARLTMMEAGDKVYTAEQTKRMMFNKDLNNIMMDNGIGNAPKIVVNNTGMTEQQMESVMMRTLGSMAIESTNIDVNGFTKVISKGHSKTIEHTARITGMGLKIGR